MAQNQREPRELVVLRGIVSPVESDYGDHVTGVTIISDDYEELRVAPYGAGEDLLDLLDEYVEVSGFLTEEGGEEMIVVRELRVIDDNEGSARDDRGSDDDGDSRRFAG